MTVRYMDPVLLSGSFTDPGADDTHTNRWQVFAGGATTPLFTAWGNLDLAVNWLDWMSDYPAPGNYTAVLTVTDDDGGTGQATMAVTIVPRDTVLSVPNGEIIRDCLFCTLYYCY